MDDPRATVKLRSLDGMRMGFYADTSQCPSLEFDSPRTLVEKRRMNVCYLGLTPMTKFFFERTSSSSTAGREARIQTGALPAVGWSVLFAL
ncbi:MAG: hypothetical protein ABI600_01565, partial [Luteolibacter sp.]